MDELAGYFARETGCTPVLGFAEIEDLGGGVEGGRRVTGHMETADLRDWYLRLDSKAGMSWKTAPVPSDPLGRVSFVLATGFGNGSPLPQPSGQWDVYVNGRKAVSIRAVKHSQFWKQGECSLAFTANRIEAAEPFGAIQLSSAATSESWAAFGPALLTVPVSWIEPGRPAMIRVVGTSEQPSDRWLLLAASPRVSYGSDIFPAIEMLAGKPRPTSSGYNVYFGDIHTHSGEVDGYENLTIGCGMGSREDSYRFAQGPGGLDIYALTDHECQVNPARTGEYFALADKYNRDGEFVCLPAYEFTSPFYGHRNVYFRESGGVLFSSLRPTWPGLAEPGPDDVTSPDELWAALDAYGRPAITVPHHPSATSHPLTWDFFSPKYDRLVEVYSSWGSSEYYGDFPRGVSDRYPSLYVRGALDRGYRMGLIASSDGHDGHPGDAQSPFVKHHHLFHHLGSGWVGVLTNEPTRASVYDALHARRCYGTTGVPVGLSFEINGSPMGSEVPYIPAGMAPRIEATCQGTNGIDHLRLVKNGRVVLTVPCHGERSFDLEWEDPDYTRDEPSYYYLRAVQVDHESAWSSPIWVG